MINFNGNLLENSNVITTSNRSFLYGDGVFETLKIVNSKILFLEEHYFRLMASMRIIRMQIPMSFTLEYIEEQIMLVVNANEIQESARVRLVVYRNDGGFYMPEAYSVSFIIEAFSLENKKYLEKNNQYEVELYKDFLITKQLLSTLKTTNRIINVMASVFAKDNNYASCLLLNDEKNVIEAINGNIFMLKDNVLVTPPLTDGCINGIIRKQILGIAKTIDNLNVEEKSISTFDLQNADELFITNVITGIQSVTKYRKKEFGSLFASQLLNKLNAVIED